MHELLRPDPSSLANRKNAVGETALHSASKAGHSKCVQVLLESNAISYETLYGRTPAYFATVNSHTDVVRELCCKGHIGEEESKQLVLISASRNDFATTAVLQRNLDPSLGSNQVEKRAASPTKEIERRHKLAEQLKKQALRRPSKPAKPLPEDPETWSSENVSQWVLQTGQCDPTTCVDIRRKIIATEFTGKILFSFTALELRRLFGILGVPSQARAGLVAELGTKKALLSDSVQQAARPLTVAVGRDLSWFRFVDVVHVHASGKLNDLRPLVDTVLKSNNVPIPAFKFVTLSNQVVDVANENNVYVSQLGLFILVSSSTT